MRGLEVFVAPSYVGRGASDRRGSVHGVSGYAPGAPLRTLSSGLVSDGRYEERGAGGVPRRLWGIPRECRCGQHLSSSWRVVSDQDFWKVSGVWIEVL